MAAVVLALGTVVTGSGPHSGDADEPARFGFDARTVSWLHADVVMLFLGLVVATWLTARLTAAPGVTGPGRAWLAVLLVSLAQGLVGYVQYFTDLPEALVVAHMLGASLLVVALTHGILALRRRADEDQLLPTVSPRATRLTWPGRPPRRGMRHRAWRGCWTRARSRSWC